MGKFDEIVSNMFHTKKGLAYARPLTIDKTTGSD